MSSQRPTHHCATKEVLRPYTGDMQACKKTSPSINAPDGGGRRTCRSHHRSRAHWSSVPGVSVCLCLCKLCNLQLVCVLVYVAMVCVHDFFSASSLCCVWISKLHLPTAPPPLNEGESLVSRILQLGPPGTKFLGYD